MRTTGKHSLASLAAVAQWVPIQKLLIDWLAELVPATQEQYHRTLTDYSPHSYKTPLMLTYDEV